MIIDVVFDTVCPWCFIGKRRLEHALSLRPSISLEIRWRPFLLNPHMPEDGVEQSAYLIRKFGSENRVRRVYGALVEAGESVSIEFAFERIGRAPNSLNAHRLVRYADRFGLAAEVVEALFSAYFVQGRNTGDVDVLADLAASIGLDKADTRSFLDSNAESDWVDEENTRAHRLGINGVPAFIIDNQHAIAGAQESAILARLIDAAQAHSVSIGLTAQTAMS